MPHYNHHNSLMNLTQFTHSHYLLLIATCRGRHLMPFKSCLQLYRHKKQTDTLTFETVLSQIDRKIGNIWIQILVIKLNQTTDTTGSTVLLVQMYLPVNFHKQRAVCDSVRSTWLVSKQRKQSIQLYPKLYRWIQHYNFTGREIFQQTSIQNMWK